MSETNILHTDYRWMFRDGPHLASATDQTGRFCDVSSGLLRLLGYSREQFLAFSPQDIATEETLEALTNKYLPRLRLSGQLEHVPIEYRHRSNGTVKLL